MFLNIIFIYIWMKCIVQWNSTHADNAHLLHEAQGHCIY